MKTILILGATAIALILAGCGSTPSAHAKTSTTVTSDKGGGYYLDDGPGSSPPSNLDDIPNAVPRDEPLHRFANRTYVVLGNTYTPQTRRQSYREEGMASWYGRRFHGKKTASGELYDMYAMTGAHPTLPIPSYVRVTALKNGRSVIVRINDRGPFHKNRLIDLSYAAAHKLGYLGQGSTQVRVESIDPADAGIQDDSSSEGLFLQVGAFGQPENAQNLSDKLKRELGLSDERVRVVLIGSLHRVQIGPYASEDDAHTDRVRVRERLDLNAVLVRRERREES